METINKTVELIKLLNYQIDPEAKALLKHVNEIIDHIESAGIAYKITPSVLRGFPGVQIGNNSDDLSYTSAKHWIINHLYKDVLGVSQ